MAKNEIYRVEIPIIIDDQTEAPLRQADERISKMEAGARKKFKMTREHFESIAKMKIEPIMKIKDQLTEGVLRADRLIKKLGMEKASPIIEAQDRVSAVVTRVDAALKAVDRGDVKVLAEMQGPLLDEIVKAKASLKALNNVKAGPIAELRGELFGQLTRAFTEAKKLDRLMVEPKATLRERVTSKVREIGVGLRGLTSRAWTVAVNVKEKVVGVVGRIGRMLTSPLALLGIGGGAVGIGALIKDFTMTAGRTETLNIAMQSVAKSTGTSLDELIKRRKAVMDLGIAEQEATLVMTRFMQGHLDIAQAANIARVAQDAAVIASTNSSEATETIVESISKLRPELLSQFGMTKNLNDIYADYADQLGIVVKTTDKYGKTVRHMRRDMTDAEKKQAMLNYVIAEGAKIAGTYEASMDSAFKKLGSLSRYWTDIKTKIGVPLFLASFGSIIDRLTDSFKSGIEWAEKNGAVLERWGRSVADVFDRAMDRVERIIESPEFKEAPFVEKVQMLFKAGLESAATWMDGPGGEIIANMIKRLGDLLAIGIEEVTPAIVPPAVKLGLEIGKGILGGFVEALQEDPLTAMLLGGFAGYALAPPGSKLIGLGVGMASAAAIYGAPKAFDAFESVWGPVEEAIEKQLKEQGTLYPQLMPHEIIEEQIKKQRIEEHLEKYPHLREHAMGGILTHPHLGMVAEAGPEAIIPLTKPARAWDLWQNVGERMGFFSREKVDYAIPTKIAQQRLTLSASGVGADRPTSVLTRGMSEPLEKLETETRRITTRGYEAINRIKSVVEWVKRITHTADFYTTAGDFSGTSAGPAVFMPMVTATAAKFGIPAGLLSRLIQAESSWRPGVVSHAGAIGLTQVMPDTARGMGYSVEALRRSPEIQIEAGAKYLAQQYNRFGSWPLALAAYNAGPGAVSKHGGIPPYRETQNYVAKILSPKAYARGGILSRPEVALIGEEGPEGIIPLKRPARALSLWQQIGRIMGFTTETRSKAITENLKQAAIVNFDKTAMRSDISLANKAVIENLQQVTDISKAAKQRETLHSMSSKTVNENIRQPANVTDIARYRSLKLAKNEVLAESLPRATAISESLNSAEKREVLVEKLQHFTGNEAAINQMQTVKAYARGGILTRPHMGLVAEAGPEAIIPLSTGMRPRALKLWAETGKMLGVQARANVINLADYRNIKAYASGGFAGAVQSLLVAAGGWEPDIPVSTPSVAMPGDTTVNLNFDLAGLVGQVVIESKEDIDGAVDRITGAIADNLRSVFQNMAK